MSKQIGVLGSGQLALMLTQAASKLGLTVLCYAPSFSEQMKQRLNYVEEDFENQKALANFVDEVDYVTVETENIPESILLYCEQQNKLAPSAIAVLTAQDRLKEKKLFNHLAIPTNRFVAVNDKSSLLNGSAELGYPFILKTRSQGYDGKGQTLIKNQIDMDNFLLANETAFNTQQAFIAEAVVDFDYEISIIGARNREGTIKFYDICKNKHVSGILHHTLNLKENPWQQQAQQSLIKLMDYFNYVGALTIEFFVTSNGLVANEIAPRVHNSGHWTIEGTDCSQFENHMRAVADLPLGNPASTDFSIMKNIIGNPVDENEYDKKLWHVHDYFKTPRQGRKLAHLTAVKATEQERDMLI